MLSSNRFAFKEWAAVCAALESGRQSLILRKGGIHEGPGGFEVEHHEFWLFPTQFHQEPDQLTEDAAPLLQRAAERRPAAGTIALQLYAVVDSVVRIERESMLPRLEGEHIWADHVLKQRFHYRSPGLWALIVRIHRRERPLLLPDSPHFAGCRTWVDLPQELSTEDLHPVLSDEEFTQASQRLHRALAPSEIV